MCKIDIELENKIETNTDFESTQLNLKQNNNKKFDSTNQ